MSLPRGIQPLRRWDATGVLVSVPDPLLLGIGSAPPPLGAPNTLRRGFPRQRQQGKPLRVLTPAECAASPPRGYIVKGLIAPRDVVLICGQPGSGKSILAPHLAYAVAQGRPVFGRTTKPRQVLYVPAEDPHGMRQRVSALLGEYGDAPLFRLVDGVSDLAHGNGEELFNLVLGGLYALVVIDTLAAAFPGLRENEAEDMGRVVAFARSLTERGAAVILVHHLAKAEGSTTPRGHGSLFGDADMALRLDPSTDGPVLARLMKNRNGPSGPAQSEFVFTIRAVRVGTDEDGDPITAPVLTEQDGKRPGFARLSPVEAMARGHLADLIAVEGQPLPVEGNYPGGLLGVSEECWRAVCDSRRLSTAEAADSRARAFRRAYSGLLIKRQIASQDGVVWIVGPANND